MKFGVRQIANVVFKAKNTMKIGPYEFQKGQPVFYLDTAKTSSMEGAATTVYATGGRGNTRLIAWEGEKTLTFTVEDALLSPISFAMLSGAGLLKAADTSNDEIHFHQTTTVGISEITAGLDGIRDSATASSGAAGIEIDLSDALELSEEICPTAPIYVMVIDEAGDLTGKILKNFTVDNFGEAKAATSGSGYVAGDKKGKRLVIKTTDLPTVQQNGTEDMDENGLVRSDYRGTVMVDYYVKKKSSTVSELQIDAQHFAGYYYVEADTLFRRQYDGKDLPANITFPNVKIQSNFTFSMASTGDPSTFTFTMDAFPGNTYFDRTKKVLCAIQIVDDSKEVTETTKTIFPHPSGLNMGESFYDSSASGSQSGEYDNPLNKED